MNDFLLSALAIATQKEQWKEEAKVNTEETPWRLPRKVRNTK